MPRSVQQLDDEPTSRPTVRDVPVARGDAGAQALNARITQCGYALEQSGVPTFWVPDRRHLVMQLLVGSGAAVLDVIRSTHARGRHPQVQDDREEWYLEHYLAQAQRDAGIASQEADPTRQPGRESGARHFFGAGYLLVAGVGE